jgi:hypothetical protein
VFPREASLAARGERLCPAQVTAGVPQWQVIRLMELAREHQVLVGQPVLAEDVGEESEPQSHMPVALRCNPGDLLRKDCPDWRRSRYSYSGDVRIVLGLT